jgi:DNA gyrase subunit A
MGVKLLDLEDQDKVAVAVVIPQKKPKFNPKKGTLLQ